MIHKLTASLIASMWDEISPQIQTCFPAGRFDNNDDLNTIFSKAVQDIIHIWAYTDEKFPDRVLGYMLFCIDFEPVLETPRYLLYAYVTSEHLADSVVYEAFLKIRDYARALGCFYIVAYTTNAYIVRLAKTIQPDCTEQFITIKL